VAKPRARAHIGHCTPLLRSETVVLAPMAEVKLLGRVEVVAIKIPAPHGGLSGWGPHMHAHQGASWAVNCIKCDGLREVATWVTGQFLSTNNASELNDEFPSLRYMHCLAPPETFQNTRRGGKAWCSGSCDPLRGRDRHDGPRTIQKLRCQPRGVDIFEFPIDRLCGWRESPSPRATYER
jgi:hypothetical protein